MGRFAFLRTLALLDCRDPNVMSLFLVTRESGVLARRWRRPPPPPRRRPKGLGKRARDKVIWYRVLTGLAKDWIVLARLPEGPVLSVEGSQKLRWE